MRAFVALGSNLGDRAALLRDAVRALGLLERTQVTAQSAVHETPALLPAENLTPQPNYLNAVVELDTGLSSPELHRHLQRIEKELGREPATRWAPRPIDLDLLLFGDLIVTTEALTVPHARMHERRFVLEPMVELAPELVHPVVRKTMRALLRELEATVGSG